MRSKSSLTGRNLSRALLMVSACGLASPAFATTQPAEVSHTGRITLGKPGTRLADAMGETRADTSRAQPAPTSSDVASATQTAPGDIVVTANRTESVASKTPITLTAIRGADLISKGVNNPTELTSVVPGIEIDRGNANGLQINIRGITSTGTTSPSAAFLIDGIYIQQQNAQEVSFYDLDRVEVLRGPQGTLYGRNTTAGVINVISATPKSTFGASIDASYGNYNARQVTAAANVPVSDTLAFRLAGNYEARDTYYHQTVPQNYSNPLDTDNRSVRLSGLYKPSDKIRLLVKLDYTAMRGAGAGFGSPPLISNFYQVPLAVPGNGVREPDPVYLDPSASQALAKKYANAASFHTRDSTWGAMSQFDWKLAPDLTFTALGAYREYRRNDQGSVFWGADYNSGEPVYSVYTASTIQLSRSNSEEARLAYDNGTLKAQIGLYHFYNHDVSTLFFGNFGLPVFGAWQKSAGVFGQATYSLTDHWRLTGGLRYTKDTLFNDSGVELSLPFGIQPLGESVQSGSSSKITWKASTDFDLSPTTLAYVTVATGYKAIGFNPNCDTRTPGCIYKPENLTDYEGGIKARLFDSKLIFNLDYFHYVYKNLQISQIVTQITNGVAAPGSVTTNAAAAKVDGVELEGSFLPAPNNRFDFSAAWLDGRYVTYLLEPDNPQSGNFNGDRLDHSPTWTFSAGYNYTLPLGNGSNIVASAHTRYTSSYVIINTVVNAQFRQPGFTKTDLTLRFNAPHNAWYLEGFVKNLENKIDVTYINTAPGWPTLNDGTVNTGDPRTFGVRAGLTF